MANDGQWSSISTWYLKASRPPNWSGSVFSIILSGPSPNHPQGKQQDSSREDVVTPATRPPCVCHLTQIQPNQQLLDRLRTEGEFLRSYYRMKAFKYKWWCRPRRSANCIWYKKCADLSQLSAAGGLKDGFLRVRADLLIPSRVQSSTAQLFSWFVFSQV